MKRSMTLCLTLLLALFLLAGRAQAAEGYAVEKVNVTGTQATATVTAEQPCTLFAALYDRNGKMLDVTTVNVPAEISKEEQLTLAIQKAGADHIKVFLTENGSAKPLCKAESAPVKAEISSDVYAIQSEDGKTLTFYNKLPAGASLNDEKTWKLEEYYNHDYYDDYGKEAVPAIEDHVLPPWIHGSEWWEWNLTSDVETVVFAEDIKPVSTAYWFYECDLINSIKGIEYLNTSNVTDMSHMFDTCASLPTLDVTGFDTSNVTDMSGMFSSCVKLTSLDITGFDTSNVTNMNAMFYGCQDLSALDVSGFDTSKVLDMSATFMNCDNLLNLDVTGFDTSNVTNMGGMFCGCMNLSNLDVSSFDTSEVTDMRHMFYQCEALVSLDVSGFNTSKVKDMSNMFAYCSDILNLNVSNFDTSKVTDMNGMFHACDKLPNLDVSSFDTSEVTDMSSMFCGCEALRSLDVSGFDTSRVANMYYMFAACDSLLSLDVSKFDTSEVTDMCRMFAGCDNLSTLDISGFDTSKVEDIRMFEECTNLKTIWASPSFVTSQVEYSNRMFYDCPNLTGGNGTKYSEDHTDAEYARIDAPGTPGYFTAKT